MTGYDTGKTGLQGRLFHEAPQTMIPGCNIVLNREFLGQLSIVRQTLL